MPVPVSHPGVYVEEIPSGVQPVTGVATSIAVFVGWAPMGPVSEATLVLSWSDYSRQFGGLDARSILGYSVSQFFANGGQQAYIIRLEASATPGTLTLGTSPNALLKLTALSPGAWSLNYGIAIKAVTGSTTRFQLRVVNVPPSPATEVTVESFDNVSMVSPDPQGRFVSDVINGESNYITASIVTPTGSGVAVVPANTTPPSPNLAAAAMERCSIPTRSLSKPLSTSATTPRRASRCSITSICSIFCACRAKPMLPASSRRSRRTAKAAALFCLRIPTPTSSIT